GAFSTKMNPSASAPASTAVIASSRLVIPQIFTLTIELCRRGRRSARSRRIDALALERQLPDPGADVAGRDESLADEDRVGPRLDAPPDLGWDHGAGRGPSQWPLRHAPDAAV